MNAKPRKARVRLTRTVTEIAVVVLDRDGYVEEIVEVCEEVEDFDCEVDNIIHVLSEYK